MAIMGSGICCDGISYHDSNRNIERAALVYSPDIVPNRIFTID